MLDPQRVYTEEYYKIRAYEFENRYPWFLLMAHQLVKLFPNTIHSLEVGCAKGYLVKALRSRGVYAYGTDISDHALRLAPEDVRVYLKKGDVQKQIPFWPEGFDLVTAFECMEHLPHPSRAIKEIRRVLKRDGLFIMGVPKITIWRRLFNWTFGQAEVHPAELTKKEWIRLFYIEGFTYMGDFKKLVGKDWKPMHEIMRNNTHEMTPCLSVGRFLKKLGPVGRWIRVELNLLAWQSEYFIFQKRN